MDEPSSNNLNNISIDELLNDVKFYYLNPENYPVLKCLEKYINIKIKNLIDTFMNKITPKMSIPRLKMIFLRKHLHFSTS